MILTVGLTGGIASGKSTILRFFRELGCHTVDADTIVSSLYEPGRAGHAALIEEYGREITDAAGRIDRARLAAQAFASPEEAQRLNALIHPLVIAEEKTMMEEASRVAEDLIYVVEATLLLESGGRSRYDRIVVVDVDPEVQLERAVSRGMEWEDAGRRLAHQMPRRERLNQADYVIDNSGDLEAAREATRRVHESLWQDLRRKKMASG